MIDPRTLREIVDFADCHIVPSCFDLPGQFGVPDLTVRLDRHIDSSIGSECDAELVKYFEVMFGSKIQGKLKIPGRKSGLSVISDLKTGTILLKTKRKINREVFLAKALNAVGNQVAWESVMSPVCDSFAAHLSMIHSAFLLLYHFKIDVYHSRFDWVRDLISRCKNNGLSLADGEMINNRVAFDISVPRELVTQLNSQIPMNDLRAIYDPAFDNEDEIGSSFPNKSLRETGDMFYVKLPYSKSLRGEVTFPK